MGEGAGQNRRGFLPLKTKGLNLEVIEVIASERCFSLNVNLDIDCCEVLGLVEGILT